MAGYTPKPGDRIRATKVHEVTVSKVTDDGQIVSTAGRWFHPEVFDIELIEAAPVPFVVGGPITPEMGEPPVGSVIGWQGGYDGDNVWLRHEDGWYGATVSGQVGRWLHLALVDPEHLVLLRLGPGSVAS